MTHPNYNQWPAEIQDQYDKTAETIKKHGHTIKSVVDGKGNLEWPFAYTLAHLSPPVLNFFLFSP